jgi:CheY-like chemotaxis protein
MPVLRIKLPHSGEITHQLSESRISIGRRPDNTIQILDRSVSAYHAELISVDGHYRLRDLQSTNLSFVDGEPVSEFQLNRACQLTFGTVQCEFDAVNAATEDPGRLTNAQLEKDVAFLRVENMDLLDKIDALQRRIDILSSARLVTGRSDQTLSAGAADSFRAVSAERDDLRHQSTGLKLELEQLRQELTLTIRERDAARQVAELLQAERAAVARELNDALQKKGTQRIDAPVATPAIPLVDDAASTQKLLTLAPPGLEKAPPLLRKLREHIDELASTSALSACQAASETASELTRETATLGDHSFATISRSLSDSLQDLLANPETLRPATIRTFSAALDLLGKLLEPAVFARGKSPSPTHVLAIDDDADLLATVDASLQLAQIQMHACGSGEEGLTAAETRKFDLVLVDVTLPGMDGTMFCSRIRTRPNYRKTPVIFLTVSDTLDKRAATSLSGGSDFIGKPFNIFDLALKAQTWTVKHQLGLIEAS